MKEKSTNNRPNLIVEDYFNGNIKAWGHIQNWRGKVIQRFDLTLTGTWNGNKCRLDEIFTYYDTSKTMKRHWIIEKKEDGTYEGTASDVIGKAVPNIFKSSINWNYIMRIGSNKHKHNIHMDDWMHLMNDGVLINQIRMKKFGITVGNITIFMKK